MVCLSFGVTAHLSLCEFYGTYLVFLFLAQFPVHAGPRLTLRVTALALIPVLLPTHFALQIESIFLHILVPTAFSRSFLSDCCYSALLLGSSCISKQS